MKKRTFHIFTPVFLFIPLGKSNAAIVVKSLIGFMSSSNLESNPTPYMNCSPPEEAQLKSAKIKKNVTSKEQCHICRYLS